MIALPSRNMCTRLSIATAAFVLADCALPLTTSSPRGWNSWYNFLGASNETETLSAAQYMAENLLQFGYESITIDEGWAESPPGTLLVDANGLPTWNTDAYPHGIPWLASQLQGMGLKLGLWIVRGVPRVAVENKMPIFNSSYTADKAVRFDRNCSWNGNTYGAALGPAAEAYYASLANKIASWGVSVIKIDCLWPNEYEGVPQTYFNDDVSQECAAFDATGNVTVSLSPGISVTPGNGTYLASNRLASIYRIAEDVLDVYEGEPDGHFPQGVHQKFAKALEYETLLGTNGTWPDFDMLQVGHTIHSYGDKVPSETHLTHDEQITSMTLWSITGTPLIIGGRLPLTSDANGTWTLGLLTNAEVLAMHNASFARRSFMPVEAPSVELYGWASTPSNAGDPSGSAYVTLFNAVDAPGQATVTFASLGLPAGTASVCVRDLWSHSWTQPVGGPVAGGSENGFTCGINAHGARALLVAHIGSTDCTVGLA